jgi:cytochrome bd-type quinol oxidase subunit 2
MGFPIAAVIGLAPQIIRAVGSLFNKKDRAQYSSKVKAGSITAAVVAGVLFGLREAGAPIDDYPALQDAGLVLAGFVAAWVKSDKS